MISPIKVTGEAAGMTCGCDEPLTTWPGALVLPPASCAVTLGMQLVGGGSPATVQVARPGVASDGVAGDRYATVACRRQPTAASSQMRLFAVHSTGGSEAGCSRTEVDPMRHLLTGLCLCMPLAALAFEPPPWVEERKEAREARKEWREHDKERREHERELAKQHREAERDWNKEQREWIKEQREAERELAKDMREDEREWLKRERERQRELRKEQRERAREGWYADGRWYDYDDDYRYRDQYREAIERHPAPHAYSPPPGYEVIVYEPGMRLPPPYFSRDHVIFEPVRYGLPPPPPAYGWVQVDDDAVLVALASGAVADFVYDLFEPR